MILIVANLHNSRSALKALINLQSMPGLVVQWLARWLALSLAQPLVATMVLPLALEQVCCLGAWRVPVQLKVPPTAPNGSTTMLISSVCIQKAIRFRWLNHERAVAQQQ